MRQKGVLQISNPTANVTFSISGLAVYSITPTLTNCTAQAGNPTTIEQGGTAQLTFLFDGTNYKCPTTAPTVTNATGTWVKVSDTKGNLTLSNPSGAVSFSVVGVLTHTVTPTARDVIISPSAPIAVVDGGSQNFLVIADGTDYKLPTSITVAGTTVNAGTETTIPNKCTVLFTRTSDTSGSIAFSNVTDDVTFSVEGEAVASYPVKGQLITMNLGNATPTAGTNNQYRVLSINGSVAEVVAMYDMSTPQPFGADNTYSGSDLDTYLNSTFYGTLSSTAKSAIVDKTFTQDSWYGGTSGSPSYNGTYLNGSTQYDYQVSLSSNAYRPAITRHVYALSIQDVIDYLGVTTSMTSANTTLTAPNIWQMFWNTTTQPSSVTFPWLRSADAGYSDRACLADGYRGRVGGGRVNGFGTARPALTIDLSKISWS